MRRMFFKILAIALLMNVGRLAQSLGDVARENREKKAEDASAAPAESDHEPGPPKGSRGEPGAEPRAERGTAGSD